MTGLAIFLLALGTFVFSRGFYRSREQHTEQLNRIGHSYGIERWLDETNREYADRIRTRIAIGKGITWRN